jgi:uncharacterized membrane protein YbhN (UPF0104 family)
MGAGSRALGALLCVACVIIAALYILFPLGRWWQVWKFGDYNAPLWVVVPVAAGMVVLAGLGFWLGWIMATTKDVSPPSVEKPEKPEKPKRGRK